MKVIETETVSKRETMIPLTIVEPDNFPAGLLLCVHGFKAGRTEDGRFLEVAETLAADNIASVMMGFPGCDESKEDFINYTLKNCLDDIDSARKYMEDHYELNGKVGMIGYSMGGRLTAMYIGDHPEVSCIGLWAAATYDGFGGSDEFLGMNIEQMKTEAEEKGYCDFHNEFDNTDIKLNKELIEQMDECVISDNLSRYQGAALIVHGDNDITVPYTTAISTYNCLKSPRERKLVTVEGADHGFGAWNNRPDLSKQLTDATISFFRRNL
ncbi:MAG: alpha/beta hydrolase [Erysipelotrichaceae bacterium]|nr:alpha/beta hydrolase [Erysipelotrichaceae bacterium]